MKRLLFAIQNHFDWRHYIPQSILCLREGYTKQRFLSDLLAGVSVGVIALPLAMAFAIASGLPPAVGLYTAVVAGFLNSLLGGCPVLIGGPTGAFVVVVYGVAAKYGADGLALATLMAGVFLLLMGIARFGVLLKFISYPVIIGFTSGIAVVLVGLQIKDFFGLQIDRKVSANFFDTWSANLSFAHTVNIYAVLVGATALFLILWLRRRFPKVPAYLIAVVLTGFFVWLLGLPVQTIGTKFGEVPRTLPVISFPVCCFDDMLELMPSAITIATLAALESLLCALIADGMTGAKSKPDTELVAQGFANIGSVMFQGMPATGAIARTAANIRMGGKTPVAGMIHAATLLLLMFGFAPLAELIPLPTLAAIIFIVAWQMGEFDRLVELLNAPFGDVAVLLISFVLTVLVDITVAVEVGIVLSTFLFIKHISDRTTMSMCQTILEDKSEKPAVLLDSETLYQKDIPNQIVLFEVNGPLFFGVSELLYEGVKHMAPGKHKFFILRMRHVPLIDASGMRALLELHKRCHTLGMVLLLSGVSEELLKTLKHAHVDHKIGHSHIFPHIDAALKYAKEHL